MRGGHRATRWSSPCPGGARARSAPGSWSPGRRRGLSRGARRRGGEVAACGERESAHRGDESARRVRRGTWPISRRCGARWSRRRRRRCSPSASRVPSCRASASRATLQGGVSGPALTRLVFVRRATSCEPRGALNLEVFEDFIAEVEDAEVENGATYILNKIQGVRAHGGLDPVPAGTPGFADMERFLGLLGEDGGRRAPLTPQTLFETVRMASPRKTLRRAALIFAGRIRRRRQEYAAVEGGGLDGPSRRHPQADDGASVPRVPHPRRQRPAADGSGQIRPHQQMMARHFVAYADEFISPPDRLARRDRRPQHISRTGTHGVQYGARRAPAGTHRLRGGERPAVHRNPHRRLHHGEPAWVGRLWRVDALSTTRRPARVQAFEIVSYYRHTVKGFEAGGRSRHRRIPIVVESRPLDHGLSARRNPQHESIPRALSHDGHQPQPGALALDVLPLPRTRHREVRVADHRSGGARGHEQPHHAQPGVHGLPPRPRPGSRRVPEL